MFRNQNKNIIHNANFNIWQRGTSFADIATNNFSVDRWKYAYVSAEAKTTITRATDVPNSNSTYSLKVACSTQSSGINANEYSYIQQGIEGYVFGSVRLVPMTLTFWVRAYQTGTYCIALCSSGADESYISEYTVNSSATWEKKQIIIPPIPAGTWGIGNNVSGYLRFVFECGSDKQGNVGWQASDVLATSNQVAMFASTNNYLELSQVQLEPGGMPSEFERISPMIETEQCQRYFLGLAGESTTPLVYINGMSNSSTVAEFMVYVPQEMRAAPSVDALSTSGWQPSLVGTNYQCGPISLVGTSDQKNFVYLQITGSSGMTTGNPCKLSTSGNGQFLGLSSEI